MTNYVKEGELVEGAKCHVTTRKNIWKGLKKDPITKKTATLYVLDRNCSVKVTKSVCFESSNEENLRTSQNVHCNIDDQIQGESIQLYVDSKRNILDFKSIEGYSHRHGVQIENTKIRTVGRLKYSFSGFKKLNESSNNNLENKI